MEFLGYLKNIQLDNLSADEKLRLLVSKNLFVESFTIAIPNDGSPVLLGKNNAQKVIEPSIGLRNDFYSFVIEHYEHILIQSFLDFFYGFNNEVYGLDRSEKKLSALKYFKEFSNGLLKDHLEIFNLLQLKNGVEILENQAKFEMLSDRQNILKINLAANQELINEYLLGNEAYFTLEILESREIISKVIEFESGLKIAISLNEQFSFEKDFYFTKIHIENENRETSVIQKQPKRVKKQPLISNQEAIEYLIKNIFNHKTGQ